ncbi:alpha-2-macroglobulin [bacterium]|nr:alpha-2-macroglobulin [bacterium]
MNAKSKIINVSYVLSLLLLIGVVAPAVAENNEHVSLRKNAEKLKHDGNYKEALEIYNKLVINPLNNSQKVGEDLQMAVQCMSQLNRIDEADQLIEDAVKIHKNNWRLLMSAARSYFDAQHSGYIVAGEFFRGHHRGGGKYVNSIERDRTRALQLMEQAVTKAEKEYAVDELTDIYLEFARMLVGDRGYNGAWRLQYLTDLSVLPDYEDGYWHWSSRSQGAPVDADGNPVFYYVPESYAKALTDGERWRCMLKQAMERNPERTNEIQLGFANFLQQQFGVNTMAYYGWFRGYNDGDKNTSGTYDLPTLKEKETIARLATGISRFTLPDEFNFIKIYKEITKGKSSFKRSANWALADLFENRLQFTKAVSYWKKVNDTASTDRINNILGNWGRFEPVQTQPAGQGASVEFRFRNGKEVEFTAHEIDIWKLVGDVKKYLKSNPEEIDWEKMDINNIGYLLVKEHGEKYIGRKVAEWSLGLKSRPNHFDKRITISTPLQKAGCYLLTAKMKDGNISKIVIWINDTVIVKKRLDQKALFFVADAVTGEPLENIKVDFFGYKQERTDWDNNPKRRYNVIVKNLSLNTDSDGQVFPESDVFMSTFTWLTIAHDQKGRLAYLGFSGIWYGNYYDSEYNQVKVFTITDRPVYRPDQSVKFKSWVRNAQYDKEDVSQFADQQFQVEIRDPKNEKIFSETFTSDSYGGLDGEYSLPEDAALGVYSIRLSAGGRSHSSNFRVEEYKKPEFEVSIEAPSEPVMLGEKITARIVAKYYFGAPVTEAKVKYKVLRSDYRANWYPFGNWDWFYGPGYWWFAYDYTWYPGWFKWGCKRPHWWWWPSNRTPPEIVAEAEVEIGENGIVDIPIDTSIAKEFHGNTDHRYSITAEVTDKSRRTIVGTGQVLVAREPFKVYAWVDRGYYRKGDVVRASFSAMTLDNKPVKGKGVLNLYRITYKDNKPVETPEYRKKLNTDADGKASTQIKASSAGQYRLSYKLTDAKGHVIEGGYVFHVMGAGTDGSGFKFNQIELVPDKREYAPGDKVSLMINTDRVGSTVVLFTRPSNGIYLKPKIIRMTGKSVKEEIIVKKKDMPNFFIEAFTISDGKIYSETREIVVPPEKRVLNVDVIASSEKYKPGEQAKVKIRLSDYYGKPFSGSTVISIYDKAVEYISGGSNVPQIKEFFWKWRRRHYPSAESNLDRYFNELVNSMRNLGIFGHLIADISADTNSDSGRGERETGLKLNKKSKKMQEFLPGLPMKQDKMEEGLSAGSGSAEDDTQMVTPIVRTKFADTAFWAASLMTDKNGIAEVKLPMPDNLTTWKIKTWAMGHGTKVGEGSTEVITTKALLIRLQAPRFFVEKDEVVISANVHNYLKKTKTVKVILEVDGGCIELMDDPAKQTVKIPPQGESRVDWRVKVLKEGQAIVRMKALTDEESDAIQMKFPVYVHGMLKTESFSGAMRPDEEKLNILLNVPSERRVNESRLEIRYSPTLAAAMVDALPYMVSYPYGCTEQTLNRFLPTVISQKILLDMGLNLKQIRDKRTNLNAQEIGVDKDRAKQWKRWENQNPVFDEKTVEDMVNKGLNRLSAMQISDGGWGWFSGWGEKSYPHTTALVVHGLQIAEENGVSVPGNMIKKGVAWLKDYQKEQLQKLKNWPERREPYKQYADNIDAFVYMVLVDAEIRNNKMRDFLYRDRNHIAVYAKAMFGMALHKQQDNKRLSMIIQNIEQYLVNDDENQTAWLNLPNSSYWWYWYGSEMEAHAYYLKLLAKTEPKSVKASRLVKYLLNNRKHATYWNSTRDTAICIEAISDYLRASGEDKPDMTVEIFMDGNMQKESRISADNLFTFDNKLVLEGKAVESGKHNIEFRKKGKGSLYCNAYLTNFTLEDHIAKAGLEVKVNRTYYKLVNVEKKVKAAGSRGQVLNQKVEKYKREEIPNLGTLKSGDLVEIELTIESKNDYEYLVFEDMKAAGFEPVEVRSGYNGNDLGAYMEFRDEKVCIFVRRLARGKHSVSYRMRAEIPGRFSALPTRVYAMYAPELKGNSDEIKLNIKD